MASGDPVSFQEITGGNSDWGVCGFIAAIGALLAKKQLRVKMTSSNDKAKVKDAVQSRLRDYVRAYLQHLKENKSPFISDIENFTDKFDGGKGFKVDAWLQKAPVGGSPIAMPPHAMVDLLKFLNGATAQYGDPKNPGANAILGLGTGKEPEGRPTYKGLKHWVYQEAPNQNIYTWGNPYKLTDLQADDDLKEVLYVVKL